MSTLRVNNIQFNPDGNTIISAVNTNNIVITVDGTEKLKVAKEGVNFRGPISVNNTPIFGGSGQFIATINLANQVSNVLNVSSGGTGLTAVGTSGNVLTSNGTSWVSQAPPPSSPVYQTIASGNLLNGDKVVINSNGTVSVISGKDEEIGSSATYTATSLTSALQSSVYDPVQNKVIVAYSFSGSGYAVVGTVSGTSISFGTPVSFNLSGAKNYISTTYHAAQQKIVIVYSDFGNNYGTAVVGTVSGTSISFGTPVVFDSGSVSFTSTTYDPNQQRVVIGYQESSGVCAIVGTVSGTSISFGTRVIADGVGASNQSIVYDLSQQKIVLTYNSGSNYYSIIGTVSGTSISFGTKVLWESGPTDDIFSVYDSDEAKIVVFYYNNSSQTLKVIVGTVSGTSISFGTSTTVETSVSAKGFGCVVYNPDIKKSIFTYKISSNFKYFMGKVSGTSISIEPIVTIATISVSFITSTYHSTEKQIVIFYANASNSSRGTAICLQPYLSNLTAENYIGISDGTYSNGQLATIQVAGAVDDAQINLTPGKKYYVNANGVLKTTASVVSVTAGTAVSNTKIIIKG